MDVRWLRVLYAIEFFVALAGVFLAWTEIGGPAHLDLIDWPWKFVLGVGLPVILVLGTHQAVADRWRSAVLCLGLALLWVAAMGAVTYYYHLHEEELTPDENVETRRT
ncbi:MAG: hypothetical protein ACRD44_15430 [Bryobacteraceae bacterium]